MFNPDYYPTPKKVIEQMLSHLIQKVEIDENNTDFRYEERIRNRSLSYIKQCTVLDPSAGDGNLLEYLEDLGVKPSKLYAVEIEPELQHILRSKNFKVIGTDFLAMESVDIYFDLIIMNPPFSNGVKHVLHAWQLLKQGHLVSLINAESINNPYTEERKLLAKIIEDHGSVEFIGRPFADSERPTDVEVAMIKLHKQPDSKFDFKFSNIKGENEQINFDSLDFSNALATKDEVGNLILQMDRLKHWFLQYLEAYRALEFYFSPLTNNEYFKIDDFLKSLEGDNTERYNDFMEHITKRVWDIVFSKLDIDKYMTSGVRDEYDRFIKHQGTMPFTKPNVFALVDMIFTNRYTILDKAIEEVFDLFTAYHKENRLHIEGWKTNDSWKVNRKIIIPYFVRYGEYCTPDNLKQYGDRFAFNYTTKGRYMDIDKALCYIAGRDYNHITTLHDSMDRHFHNLGKVKTGDSFINEGESTFWKWKFWKKGTVHITFKDEWLWQEFNMRACALKKWLPKNEEDEWKRSTNSEPVQPTAPQPVAELAAPTITELW